MQLQMGSVRIVKFPKEEMGLPKWLSDKESTCQCRRPGFNPLGRSPGEKNGNLLQYSCLGNPMDREPGSLQSMGSQKSQT